MLRVQSVTEQGGELLYFDQLGGFQGEIMSFTCTKMQERVGLL